MRESRAAPSGADGYGGPADVKVRRNGASETLMGAAIVPVHLDRLRTNECASEAAFGVSSQYAFIATVARGATVVVKSTIHGTTTHLEPPALPGPAAVSGAVVTRTDPTAPARAVGVAPPGPSASLLRDRRCPVYD
ncbi:MAG: hypothetical protein ACRDX8_15220, partial [Acidimicrobiales bacterium]